MQCAVHDLISSTGILEEKGVRSKKFDVISQTTFSLSAGSLWMGLICIQGKCLRLKPGHTFVYMHEHDRGINFVPTSLSSSKYKACVSSNLTHAGSVFLLLIA